MRRMYSEKELSVLVYQAVGQYIEDGALDESIASAVDSYLEEHPVDITALEGQDIELNSLDATGLVTGGEIVEKMSGYSLTKQSSTGVTKSWDYAGVVKNGNKLTLAIAIEITRSSEFPNDYMGLCKFTIPSSVASKIIPTTLAGLSNGLSIININVWSAFNTTSKILKLGITKSGTNGIDIQVLGGMQGLTTETTYYMRFDITFLLSENLAE